jgi:hypothetical protein
MRITFCLSAVVVHEADARALVWEAVNPPAAVLALRLRRWRVVHRGNGDVHRGRGRPTIAIRDSVGEAISAVEVGSRRVREGAVGVLAHHATLSRRSGEGGDAQGISIVIGVVREDCYVGGCVLSGCNRVVYRRRRSVVSVVNDQAPAADGACIKLRVVYDVELPGAVRVAAVENRQRRAVRS